MSTPLLRAVNLSKSYPSAEGPLEVLRGVHLSIHPGDFVAIVGASGSGKSTLLHILGTLDRPTGGEVFFEENPVFALDEESLATFRNRKIGFVFQFHHLLPEFTALENVALPAMIAGRPASEALQRAEVLLEMMGLTHRREHLPGQLSGGEQQRVAVARALTNAPALVLADEPTGNLDARNAEALFDRFVQLNEELGQTFVLVTHNMHLARRARCIYYLYDGTLHTEPPQE